MQVDYTSKLHFGGLAPESTEFVVHSAEEVQEVIEAFDASSHHSGDKSLQLLTVTSCFTLFSGVISSVKGMREWQLGRSLEDLTTKVKGAFHFCAGGSEVAAGGAYVGMAGATIDYVATASHISHHTAEALGKVGAAFVGASTFFYSIYWGLEVEELGTCYTKIDKMLVSGKGPKAVIQMILQDTALPRRNLRWQKAVGYELIEEIRAGKLPPQELLKKVQQTLDRKIAAALAYTLMSLAATVISFCAVTGVVFITPWLISALGAALGVAWLIADIPALIESLQEGHAMSWEKSWIWFSALFCLCSVLSSILFASGFVTIGVGCFVGLSLAVVHGLALHKIYHPEHCE